MIFRPGCAAAAIAGGIPIRPGTSTRNSGVNATAAARMVTTTLIPIMKRRSVRKLRAPATSAVLVTSSMITGLSTVISTLITIPNAASWVWRSGRRAITACRIGPSALISAQLAASGSQNRSIWRWVDTAVSSGTVFLAELAVRGESTNGRVASAGGPDARRGGAGDVSAHRRAAATKQTAPRRRNPKGAWVLRAIAALLLLDDPHRDRLRRRALRSPHNTHARDPLYFHHGLLGLGSDLIPIENRIFTAETPRTPRCTSSYYREDESW